MVEATLRKHRQADKYRVRAVRNQIEVYEQIGADADEIIMLLKQDALLNLRLHLEQGLHQRVRETIKGDSRFECIVRFILNDPDNQTFRVERRSYTGSRGKWIPRVQDRAE